jgi:hypothetical protein
MYKIYKIYKHKSRVIRKEKITIRLSGFGNTIILKSLIRLSNLVKERIRR